MFKNLFFTLLLSVSSLFSNAQVNIVSSMFNAFNVSEQTLLYANIMNSGEEQDAYLEAKLYNGLNQPIMSVKSNVFKLRNGLNNTAQISISSSSVIYGSDNDAQYIKTMHQLPSGKFRFCLFVVPASNSEPVDFCEEFENETSTFLFLINPADQDTIETKTPILLWNHSDPFTLLKQGEMYRLILVEQKKDQSADAAINVNSPLLKLDFLTRHDVQYPFDATKLENGKKYAWQVHKIINNVVVNKTEAWEFVIKPDVETLYNKYVEISKEPRPSVYYATGKKIFFTFKEEYYSNKNLKISITPENKETLTNVKVKEDDVLNPKINSKESGENKYEIDLNELNIESGYYFLNIINEKGQVYQLKFYVN
jgi:hypothetical protein